MQGLFEVFKVWIPSGMLVILVSNILDGNNFDGEKMFLIWHNSLRLVLVCFHLLVVYSAIVLTKFKRVLT